MTTTEKSCNTVFALCRLTDGSMVFLTADQFCRYAHLIDELVKLVEVN